MTLQPIKPLKTMSFFLNNYVTVHPVLLNLELIMITTKFKFKFEYY